MNDKKKQDEELEILQQALNAKFITPESKSQFEVLESKIDAELAIQANKANMKYEKRLEDEGIDINKLDYKHKMLGRDQAPGVDTLMRIYNYGGKRSETWKLSTTQKTILAHSLGFENWGEFITGDLEYDRLYDLYKYDGGMDQEIALLKPRTRIRFNLGSYSKSFIVEKLSDHMFSYQLLGVVGLKLNRKVGETFFAPAFCIQNEDSKDPVVFIEDFDGWFDDPNQDDLNISEEYFRL